MLHKFRDYLASLTASDLALAGTGAALVLGGGGALGTTAFYLVPKYVMDPAQVWQQAVDAPDGAVLGDMRHWRVRQWESEGKPCTTVTLLDGRGRNMRDSAETRCGAERPVSRGRSYTSSLPQARV